MFAPVIKFSVLRLSLGVHISKDLELHQIDVWTAFRSDDMFEDRYTKQLKYFIDEITSMLVCKPQQRFIDWDEHQKNDFK